MTPIFAREETAERSFERLYRAHVEDVYRYTLMVLRSPADAEDVTQTTFLKAYRAFQRGERPEKPRHWLLRIAHNTCRTRFRDASRRPREVALEERDVVAVHDAEDAPTAAEVQRALGFLSFNQRSALVMRELEGRSYSEIAELLEISVSAVETLLFRARRALREQLEGALACGDAERAVYREMDGSLGADEKRALRAHLRECKECARLARRERGRRAVLRSLGPVPLPPSLSSFGNVLAGGGAAAAGGVGLTAKVAAVIAAGVVAGGAGYEGAGALASLRAATGGNEPLAPAVVADPSAKAASNGQKDSDLISRTVGTVVEDKPLVTSAPDAEGTGGGRATLADERAAQPTGTETAADVPVKVPPVTVPKVDVPKVTVPAAPVQAPSAPVTLPALPVSPTTPALPQPPPPPKLP